MFQTQLFRVFQTHRPHVVLDAESDLPAALVKITQWLTSSDNWVFVLEDVCGAEVMNIIPTESKGRVLMTSQQPLHTTMEEVAWFTHVEALDCISTTDSIELIRSQNVFAKKNISDYIASMQTDTQTYEMKCRAIGIDPAILTASSKHTKKNMDSAMMALYTEEQLSLPEFGEFLSGKLGNLPLSVSLCAQLLRVDPDIDAVHTLITQFDRQDISHVESSLHNRVLDKHYIGLATSVRMILSRLQDRAGVSEDAARVLDGTESVLFVLSLLDRAQTPMHLLTGHNIGNMSDTISKCFNERCSSEADELSVRDVDLLLKPFHEAESISRAVGVIRNFGLCQENAGDPDSVGVMHQVVQKCIRELVTNTAPTLSKALCLFAMEIVCDRFTYDDYENPTAVYTRLHNMELCASALCGNICGHPIQHRPLPKQIYVIRCKIVNFAYHITRNTKAALCHAKGNVRDAVREYSQRCSVQSYKTMLALVNFALGQYQDALVLQRDILACNMQVLPPDHADIAAAMHNLANTYSALGQHHSALALEKNALSIRKRVLPAGHPDIVAAMNNLANTYNALEQHQDALVLQQETLSFRKRVLPPDNPDIATAMNNLAVTWCALGRHESALSLVQEALALTKRVLPRDHPNIAAAMNNLASIYNALGQHQEALVLQQDTLAFVKRVLPPDHRTIATSTSNVANTYSALGQHHHALVLQQDTLAFVRRMLPPDHPDIATAMSNVANAYNALGKHQDALELQQGTLVFRKRVLPPDHFDIAVSMSILASTYSALGLHQDALELQQDTLVFSKRVLPPDHPDIAALIRNFASNGQSMPSLLWNGKEEPLGGMTQQCLDDSDGKQAVFVYTGSWNEQCEPHGTPSDLTVRVSGDEELWCTWRDTEPHGVRFCRTSSTLKWSYGATISADEIELMLMLPQPQKVVVECVIKGIVAVSTVAMVDEAHSQKLRAWPHATHRAGFVGSDASDVKGNPLCTTTERSMLTPSSTGTPPNIKAYGTRRDPVLRRLVALVEGIVRISKLSGDSADSFVQACATDIGNALLPEAAVMLFGATEHLLCRECTYDPTSILPALDSIINHINRRFEQGRSLMNNMQILCSVLHTHMAEIARLQSAMQNLQFSVQDFGIENNSNGESAAIFNELDERKVQLAQFQQAYRDVLQSYIRESRVSNSNDAAFLARLDREVVRLRTRLPTLAKRGDFEQQMLSTTSNVLVVKGETGSGKSTQLPAYIADLQFDRNCSDTRAVVCVQPRKSAASTLAAHVAEEYGGARVDIKRLVACQVDKHSAARIDKGCRIMYMTEMCLFDEIMEIVAHGGEISALCEKYCAVVLDETHERNKTTDVIAGLFKQSFVKSPERFLNFKLVITSATLDTDLFSSFFNQAPVLSIPGRLFPIDVRYAKQPVEGKLRIKRAYETVKTICKAQSAGDILVFLPGKRDISECVAELTRDAKHMQCACADTVIALALHADLSCDVQREICQQGKPNFRRVIFSTNIAETSVTIPGVKYVVDTGLSQQHFYDHKKGNALFKGEQNSTHNMLEFFVCHSIAPSKQSRETLVWQCYISNVTYCERTDRCAKSI